MPSQLIKEICSNEQIELCHKYGILSTTEQLQLEQLEETFNGVKDSDYNQVIQFISKLKHRYNTQLQSQSIQTQADDLKRLQLLNQVQYLSSLLEEYGDVHEEMSDLIQALRKLRIEWKHRKKDIENIILSILSSSPLKNKSFRVLKINKSNSHMLGLGVGSIGKHYIVFEEGLTEDDRKDILNQVSQDFRSVFQENAAHNMTRMANTYPRIFQDPEVDMLQELDTLSQQLYCSNSASLMYPITSRKSVISFTSKSSPTMLHVADPQFEPAERDWSHLLKYKRPRERPTWGSPATYRGVWSTSVSHLADQFTKVAESYYANMLNHARTTLSQQSHTYEFVTDSLLKLYLSLRLEKGRANLSKSLSILYRLQKNSL